VRRLISKGRAWPRAACCVRDWDESWISERALPRPPATSHASERICGAALARSRGVDPDCGDGTGWLMARRRAAREDLDDDHATAATRTGWLVMIGGCIGWLVVAVWRDEQLAGRCDVIGAEVFGDRPEWRMRWKPRGRTWMRKRRMNSSVASVMTLHRSRPSILVPGNVLSEDEGFANFISNRSIPMSDEAHHFAVVPKD